MPTLLAHVLAFAGAAFLLAMAPGPATAVLLRQTIRHGRRRGVATLAGIETGILFWAVTAALGLSALLAASEAAYTGLRIVGAVVLVALGAGAIVRSRRHPPLSPAADDPFPGTAMASSAVSRNRGERRAYRTGLLTNLANPKAGVFAVSFLPQFIPPHAAVLPTGLLLALVWVACDCLWYFGLVAAVHTARRWFGGPRVRSRLERLSGVALIGFGVRLALQAR